MDPDDEMEMEFFKPIAVQSTNLNCGFVDNNFQLINKRARPTPKPNIIQRCCISGQNLLSYYKMLYKS